MSEKNLSKQVKITPEAHSKLLMAKAQYPDTTARFSEVIEHMTDSYLRGDE